jgi:hypothetical protein
MWYLSLLLPAVQNVSLPVSTWCSECTVTVRNVGRRFSATLRLHAQHLNSPAVMMSSTLVYRSMWTKLLPMDSDDQYTALLGIERASRLDEGVYTCQVVDWDVQQCKSLRLEVLVRPEVEVIPKSITVERVHTYFNILCACIHTHTHTLIYIFFNMIYWAFSTTRSSTTCCNSNCVHFSWSLVWYIMCMHTYIHTYFDILCVCIRTYTLTLIYYVQCTVCVWRTQSQLHCIEGDVAVSGWLALHVVLRHATWCKYLVST